eukprot:3372866-Ditylum_brightwellii.AAC.1
MEPNIHDELILMIHKLQSDMDNNFKAMQQGHFNYFNNCLSTLSSTAVSNKESFQKIESTLDNMSNTVSNFDYWLNKAEKIYVNQQKYIK